MIRTSIYEISISGIIVAAGVITLPNGLTTALSCRWPIIRKGLIVIQIDAITLTSTFI